jgi:hypothetical protein
MKLAGRYLWTDSIDLTQTKNAINICGSSVAEGKFMSNIDISLSKLDLPATSLESQVLEFEFGSTLDVDPSFASYGISAFSIYLR